MFLSCAGQSASTCSVGRLYCCNSVISSTSTPGSTILIPSALITHYNIDILEGETRYSVTQYTAGGLFRFVEHGFKLNEEYYAGMSASERREAAAEDAGRWKGGVAMFSRLPELRKKAQVAKATA